MEHSYPLALQWRHNEPDGVSNQQRSDCLLNRLFGRRSKKTPKLRVTGLCAGNSPGTGEFPAQRTSTAENVSIWWRHHGALGFIDKAYPQNGSNSVMIPLWLYMNCSESPLTTHRLYLCICFISHHMEVVWFVFSLLHACICLRSWPLNDKLLL